MYILHESIMIIINSEMNIHRDVDLRLGKKTTGKHHKEKTMITLTPKDHGEEKPVHL